MPEVREEREREREREILTFDLKKEGWKTCDSPEMELRWRFCVLLGLMTLTVNN